MLNDEIVITPTRADSGGLTDSESKSWLERDILILINSLMGRRSQRELSHWRRTRCTLSAPSDLLSELRSEPPVREMCILLYGLVKKMKIQEFLYFCLILVTASAKGHENGKKT